MLARVCTSKDKLEDPHPLACPWYKVPGGKLLPCLYLLTNITKESPNLSVTSGSLKNIKSWLLESIRVLWHQSWLISHLSQGSSGFIQRCTQFLTPFPGTVFPAFSHGVMYFVLRALALKTLKWKFLIGYWRISTNIRKQFLKLTFRTKLIMPSERAWKTVPENGVASCVHFCFRSLGPLERCGMGISGLYKVFF